MAGEEISNAAPADPLEPGFAPTPAAHLDNTSPAVAGSNAGPSPYDARTTWRPVSALAAAIAVAALTVAIAISGVALLSRVMSGVDGMSGGVTLLVMLGAQLVMIAGTLVVAGTYRSRPVTALALKPPVGGLRSYLTALGTTLAAVAAYTAVTNFALSHDMSNDMSTMASILRGHWWPLALLVIGVGAPVSEEFLFRGFLQSALVPTRLGYWGASVVTTALWTLLHAGYSVVGLLEVFMIGMIFCLFLRRTGSLRVPLACHAIYNSLIAVVIIVTPKAVLGF